MPPSCSSESPALEEGLEHEPRRGLGDAGDTGRTDAHGRLTLDELITSVWEGLAVRGTVSCPVCSGPMVTHSLDSDGERLTGTCIGCSASLS